MKGRVLFSGQSYYHAWYLSRELRKLGWKADVLDWDPWESNQNFYHGSDIRLDHSGRWPLARHALFYLKALKDYDIFHFSNAHGMKISWLLHEAVARRLVPYSEIALLKKLGKVVVYSNNGCMDGVSRTAFSKWGPHDTCELCGWGPDVCNDAANLAWGKRRNELADYQIIFGSNRADYNDDPRCHEVPEFYCLDHEQWRPDIVIPSEFKLDVPEGTVKIFHAMGNYKRRTDAKTGKNIRCTHIYVDVIERLKREGFNVELVFVQGVSSADMRYYQAQADIVVDMLTYGFFGASIREALMLGKTSVCFLRPEWLENMARERPDYVSELPVVSATPETIYEVLKDLVLNAEKRREIGRASREFAVRYHSARAAAVRFDSIYSGLLAARGAGACCPSIRGVFGNRAKNTG